MTDAHPPAMSAASPGSDCIPQGADTAEHTVGIQITAERIFKVITIRIVIEHSDVSSSVLQLVGE